MTLHMARFLAVAALCAALCAGAACGSSGGTAADAGDPDAHATGDDGGGLAFAPVQAIFAANCVTCHDPAHPVVLEAPTFVALALTPGGAYAALVGQPAHETCGGTLVVPGDPAASYLFHKLTDETPCEGRRMPHPGMLASRPPLPDADLATVETWIRDGAHR
jgi:hypothetical protein